MYRGRRRAVVAAGTALLAVAAVVWLAASCSRSNAEARPASSDTDRGTLPPVEDLARGGEALVPFTTDAAGEVLVETAASAAGVFWATPGAESAVVSLFVDDQYVSDLVVTSQQPVPRAFAVGELAAGEHSLRVVFASDRSPVAAQTVTLDQLRIKTITPGDPEYLAARHSPVLYGRTLDNNPPLTGTGPFQNAVTDTPLLAWHTVSEPDADGHRVLEYTTLWSNEDGGTSPPALMARWGRTTDIEWTYQLEVDQAGEAVPGTATFQAPAHVSTAFAGRYEGAHPVLGTCTFNNNVCDSVGTEAGAPMRFALAATEQLGPGKAREAMMDRHPWTYQVMADEARREARVAAEPAFGSQIYDPSEYLYVAVGKMTTGAPNTDGAWVGLALGVRLAGDPTVYRSDLSVPPWAIEPDGGVATAVRLPAGTTADDVVGLEAIRVVGAGADTGSTIVVGGVARAFLLDDDSLPGQSLAGGEARGILAGNPVQLTAAAPSAELVDLSTDRSRP